MSSLFNLPTEPYHNHFFFPEYFDLSEHKQEQEQVEAQTKVTQSQPQHMPDATDAVRGQQINLDHLEPAHDPQPAPVLEISFWFFVLAS